MSTGYGRAVVAGSFHIPTHESLALIRQALALAPRVVLALTGAHLPRSPRHPFTWTERAALLGELLADSPQGRISIEPLREWWDDSRNARGLACAAARHGPEAARTCLLRLDPGVAAPPDWDVQELGSVQSTADTLRDLLHAAETPDLALAATQPQVPAAVQSFLGAFVRTPESARLREEARHLAAEKAAWSVAPYPVVLVTVDAVVRAADHVLLIRRARHPGRGLRALPGGFADPAETLYASAVRELREETRLPLDGPALRSALRDVQVFDHPGRSQRGRVITHAHFFDLPLRELPPVNGGDDAAAAHWVPAKDLAGMEEQFIDDHFMVLDRFLGLV